MPAPSSRGTPTPEPTPPSGGEALPILSGNSLVGLLTRDNVMEFVALQGALRPAGR